MEEELREWMQGKICTSHTRRPGETEIPSHNQEGLIATPIANFGQEGPLLAATVVVRNHEIHSTTAETNATTYQHLERRELSFILVATRAAKVLIVYIVRL